MSYEMRLLSCHHAPALSCASRFAQALHAWLALTQGGVQGSLVVFTAANQQFKAAADHGNGVISFLTKQKE
jgi:hypothetical protein